MPKFNPRLGDRATWGRLTQPVTCTYVERSICNGRPTGVRGWTADNGDTYTTTGTPEGGFKRA